MISQQMVDEIKYRNDIVDVISTYVSLKRAGYNLSGRCPFHSEKTPSFTVFPGTRSYYCFGCGAGGDVITFIMNTENLTYGDALRFLAKRASIDLPENQETFNRGVRRERVHEMNRVAARFFYDHLEKSREAQAYLEKRGLSPTLVKHFGIGYAPDDFGALTNHLLDKHFTREEISAAFLASISKKNGKCYDIFRHRLMFPVIDVAGNIVAFGGRTIGNNPDEPKYINTSDTPAFNKRRNLFALNFAKASCAEQMILCEGYMDVVSLHGAGFTSAVASCGTALTGEQVRLMTKYTKSVIICYDADDAGQRAADKAFALFAKAGLEAKLLKVEGAKDPDEYIRKNSKEAFALLIKNSRTRFDFRMQTVLSRYDISDAESLIKATKEIADYITGIYSAVERDVYTHRAAEKLGVPYEELKKDVERNVKREQRRSGKEQERSMMQSAAGVGDRINPDRIHHYGEVSAEEAILGVLTLYPELIKTVTVPPLSLSVDDFVTGFNRRVFEKMVSLGSTFDVGLLGDDFSPEEIGRIVRYQVERQLLTDNTVAVVGECLQKLRRKKEHDSLSLQELIERKRKQV